MKTFLFLCVFHVVGDYVLQWKSMAKGKAPFNRQFILHALLYALSMAVVFLCAPFSLAIIAWVILSLSHMFIDFLRNKVDQKYGTNRSVKVISFCVDQLLHLSFILICYYFIIRSHPGYLNQTLFLQRWFHNALGYLVILCIIWKPTEIFIYEVLAMFPIIPKKKSADEKPTDEEPENEKTAVDQVSIESALKAGAYIGFLERVIVVALVLLNAPTAIGFVLTAKSVARFKQLEDQSFAERYLVGTLLSVGIALVAILLIPRIYPFT